MDAGQERPIAVCDWIGPRVSVYSEDPGGGTGVFEPQLPIGEALAVREFGPDELACDGDPRALLVFDGEQIVLTR